MNGKPELSNEEACASVAAFLSAYSFDSSSPTIDASFAAPCQGVLLAAADSAPSVCACKFRVPHFSSFGVRELIKCLSRHAVLCVAYATHLLCCDIFYRNKFIRTSADC
jgi:hypothetical protein